jgi:hypothetical protein
VVECFNLETTEWFALTSRVEQSPGELEADGNDNDNEDDGQYIRIYVNSPLVAVVDTSLYIIPPNNREYSFDIFDRYEDY